MSLSSIPRQMRAAVLARDAARCRYCGLHQLGQTAVFHVNHITPRSRGGTTTLENLALQCPYCSLHKSDKITAVDPEDGSQAGLFHPLEQTWAEHFVLLPDATCAGRTAVGRATVAALQMNDPIPRTARAIQMMLGLMRPTPVPGTGS